MKNSYKGAFDSEAADGFPERLNYLIEANSITKKKVADKIGSTPTFISNMLHHNSRPNWQFLRAFAENFNVNLNWLILGEGEPFKSQKEDEQIRRQANAKHTKLSLDEKLAESIAARVTLKSLLYQNKDDRKINELNGKVFIGDSLDIELDNEDMQLLSVHLQKNLFMKELQWFVETYNQVIDIPEDEQLKAVSNCLLKPMLRNKKIPSTPKSDNIPRLLD